MFIPQWLVKPKYKKPLAITSKGWVDKETGELIVSVRDLDKKIKELSDALKAIDCECEFDMDIKVDDVVTDVVETKPTLETVVKNAPQPVIKRKAGRPPRAK